MHNRRNSYLHYWYLLIYKGSSRYLDSPLPLLCTVEDLSYTPLKKHVDIMSTPSPLQYPKNLNQGCVKGFSELHPPVMLQGVKTSPRIVYPLKISCKKLVYRTIILLSTRSYHILPQPPVWTVVDDLQTPSLP